MKFYAINGSPRKDHNTQILLEYSLEGVRSVYSEADIELLHVYDYLYTGCVSCFACKRIGGRSYGRCAIKDAVTPLLEKLYDADGIVIGSPVYFHDITGQLRAFLERLLFPCLEYALEYRSLARKKMPIGFIYTMNATEEKMKKMDYPERLSRMEHFAGIVFSTPLVQYCTDTYQFDDYSLYMSERFSEEEKAQRKEKHFPIDCENAFLMGQRIAGKKE